jgi:2'-5' RNA ligase
MPFAISIRCDNASGRPLRALWDRVGRLEAAHSMAALNYPPHITLAIYDDIDPNELRRAAGDVFKDAPPIELTFQAIRHFDGDPLVLWADPLPSRRLSELHAAVHAAIPPSLCRPHYQPGAWMPHASLGVNIGKERRSKALALCAEPFQPFAVTFDVGDTISFPPVGPIAEWRLRTDTGVRRAE